MHDSHFIPVVVHKYIFYLLRDWLGYYLDPDRWRACQDTWQLWLKIRLSLPKLFLFQIWEKCQLLFTQIHPFKWQNQKRYKSFICVSFAKLCVSIYPSMEVLLVFKINQRTKWTDSILNNFINWNILARKWLLEQHENNDDKLWN